ncbi:uncharacterized protein F5147DRAFT_767330 [Suillus discolor]|uniref:Uncharacterized protein n=1 Tax=Suillus discolor TaxID=1912936 RepID=A0A9P7FMB2_9AGAM|nr:uncharacterized protein F5147DRAFT_767330 [Suillus discolor]KAG2119868.1 hypothetical protein F5147DRAFT_767330 [Suillus discolor]
MEQATLLREKFGCHSVDYYFKEIMQCSRLHKGTRKANKWNAFVKKEVEHHNAALSASEKHHKACELMSKICARWQEMDEDQCTIETQDVIETLTECREMKELATHNTMIHTFNDAQRTLEKIDQELMALHSHTGVEFILLSVQGDTEHWNQPHVFHMARAAEFFDCCFKTSIGTLAFHFEGYCIAGVQGLAKTHLDEVLELKKKLSELILQKLQAAAAPAQAQHMYYTNFDTNITVKYCMVLEKWPLSKFCCPGDISSCNELRVLYYAWNTNTTCFQQLSDVEFEDWENGRDVDEDNTSTPPVPSPSPPFMETPTSTADIQSQPLSAIQSRKRPGEELNGVFSVSGEAMPVQKRAWKECSDKGKKCGPRKGKSVSASIPSSDSSATSSSDPSSSMSMSASPPSSDPSVTSSSDLTSSVSVSAPSSDPSVTSSLGPSSIPTAGVSA